MKPRIGLILLLACLTVAGYVPVNAAPQPPHHVYFPFFAKGYSAASNGWVTLLTDDFDSENANWTFEDRNGGIGGDFRPGRRTCNPYSGSHSVWLVGGGADGSQLPCGANYPNRSDSWMIYGPFDLSDATSAQVNWRVWINNDFDSADKFCYRVSGDGIQRETCIAYPTGTWSPLSYSLTDFLGDSQVSLALRFVSDAVDITAGGAFVDDVVISKCVASTCPPLANPVQNSADSATSVRLRSTP
jgi:hypothetical protein